MFMALFLFAQNVYAMPQVDYQVHIEGTGWMSPVPEGAVAGTTGQGKRIEAIIINCTDGAIEYDAHLQGTGWQGWRYSGTVAGTTGEGRRLEGIRIRLTGYIAHEYDVCYRAHIEGRGWQGWVRNGQLAGTQGQGKRMEAIQIVIVRKGEHIAY